MYVHVYRRFNFFADVCKFNFFFRFPFIQSNGKTLLELKVRIMKNTRIIIGLMLVQFILRQDRYEDSTGTPLYFYNNTTVANMTITSHFHATKRVKFCP
jgi:hypothetical protein